MAQTQLIDPKQKKLYGSRPDTLIFDDLVELPLNILGPAISRVCQHWNKWNTIFTNPSVSASSFTN